MLLLLLLGACGGNIDKPAVIKNPYAEQMKIFSRNGADAMRRERWVSAQSSFERALDAARLAHNSRLLATAWYNLGILHVAAAHPSLAEPSLKEAKTVAHSDHLPIILIRSELALALIYARAGKSYPEVNKPDDSLPADVHMSAARLAQLKGQGDLAKEAYMRVLRKGEHGRVIMKMQAEAHMGLALLAYAENDLNGARQHNGIVLKLCEKIGAPHLAAHALLLRADLYVGMPDQKKSLNQAWKMYQVLNDVKGQYDSLQKLIVLAKKGKDVEALQYLQHTLDGLEKTKTSKGQVDSAHKP
ncbi:MAG: tetratricopeptide repeat protein [Mariprofundaceae bacterium]